MGGGLRQKNLEGYHMSNFAYTYIEVVKGDSKAVLDFAENLSRHPNLGVTFKGNYGTARLLNEDTREAREKAYASLAEAFPSHEFVILMDESFLHVHLTYFGKDGQLILALHSCPCESDDCTAAGIEPIVPGQLTLNVPRVEFKYDNDDDYVCSFGLDSDRHTVWVKRSPAETKAQAFSRLLGKLKGAVSLLTLLDANTSFSLKAYANAFTIALEEAVTKEWAAIESSIGAAEESK
jgi:hypothetical protein